MARTLVTGNILRSGSIPTTALGGGVVTSSLQIVASLPTGSLSSSAQVNYPDISNIPGGIASSSTQIKDYLPTGTVSSSTQLPSGIASSSAQVTAYLPTGTVSSSGQISVFNTINGDQLATTGSNTFTAAQTISDTTNSTSYLDGALHIAGGMSVRKDVRISGSMTINGLLTAVSMSTQYVTSSEYVVGTSRITLNDDDNVRFAGLSIIDSGSSSPTSASIFWDSLKHKFIYENLSGSSYNSAIFIAGPKNTGSLGDEIGLTTDFIPVATGDDHIANSIIYQNTNQGRIGIGGTSTSATLSVTGDIYASSGITGSGIQSSGTVQITGNGTKINWFSSGYENWYAGTVTNSTAFRIGSATTADILTLATNGSATIAGDLTVDTSTFKVDSTNNRIGIGTTSPSYLADIINTGGSSAALRISGNDQSNVRLRIENVGTGGRVFELTGGQTGTNNSAFTLYDATATATRLYVDASGSFGVDTNTLYVDAVNDRVGIGTTSPRAKLHIGSDDEANLATQALFVAGAKAQYAGYVGLPQNQLVIYDNTTSTSGSGGAIGFAANAGPNQKTWIAAIESRRDSNTNDDSNYGGSLVFYTRPAQAIPQEHMRINSSGNIGIGTTNPGVKLDVRGQAQIITNSEYQLDIQSVNSSAGASVRRYSTSAYAYDVYQTSHHWRAGILGSTAYTIYDYTNLTDRLTILTTGNVGIGTTNPQRLVEIYGPALTSDTPTLRISSADSSGTRKFGIELYSRTGADVRGKFLADNNGRVYIDDNGNGGIVLQANGGGGNVGIGTTNPKTQFHLGTESPALSIGAITSYGGASGQAMAAIISRLTPSGINGGSLDFQTNDWIGASVPVTRMTILPNGNVGIGTNSPGNKLQINLSSATTYSSGATANGLTLYNTSTTNNQYVGITFSGEPTSGNAGLATIYGITTSSGNMELAFSTRASATLAERMRITATGDVYINVPTTGNAKLTVRGPGTTSSTYSFEAANSAGNTRFIVHDNGISRFFGSSGAETVRITEDGVIETKTAAGKYTLDTTFNVATYANGATVDFPSMSGMILVNDTQNTGSVTIYLVGGGNTSAAASVGGQVGSMAYVSAINGYRWTNNSGETRNVAFMVFRTRSNA